MNLSMITSELRLLPDPSLYGGPDLRAEAGRMASDRFGRMSPVEMPPVVNLCALRIRMGHDFTSYRIATGVLGRVAVKSEVSGFIRLQHYGTGNSLSKYIYVDSFESTRWTSSGERVVKVVE